MLGLHDFCDKELFLLQVISSYSKIIIKSGGIIMQVDDYVKVKGQNIYSIISDIKGKRARLEDGSWISLDKLELVEPKVISENDLRNYFRMNEFYFDGLKDQILEDNYVCDVIYQPTKEDLLALLMNIKIKDINYAQFFKWFLSYTLTFNGFYGAIVQSKTELDRTLNKTDGDLLNFVFEEIRKGISENSDKSYLVEFSDIDGLINVVKTHIQNEKNGTSIYADKEKEEYIKLVEDKRMLKYLKDSEKQLYKQFVLDLIKKENQVALEVYANGCYGGNEVFECDWFKARDIYEKLYAKYGLAIYANALGYIYYYGRTNSGKALDDLAFKYFSIGAAAGLYQSAYKQADMFYNGRGVTENKKMAMDIYFSLYQDNKKLFEKGFFDCNFADIALRIATFFISHREPDYEEAYYYLLQAQFAIDLRREHFDFYGDNDVANKINEAIENCRKQLDIKPKKSVNYDRPFWIDDFTQDNQRVFIQVKKLKNGKLKMTFKAMVDVDGNIHDHLFTFTSFGKCVLTDAIVAYGQQQLDNEIGDNYVVTHYVSNGLVTMFYFYEKCMFTLACDKFTIKDIF